MHLPHPIHVSASTLKGLVNPLREMAFTGQTLFAGQKGDLSHAVSLIMAFFIHVVPPFCEVLQDSKIHQLFSTQLTNSICQAAWSLIDPW